ncbi:hypothetical protein Rs2_03744 [Raphanus sativus]|uniref:Uncharacterized protein LOC108820059 n=1 Tax=Raphanus sativus TaxID=3726 RepID=A0A6J0KKZ8_RAPSA|nr:uncharacterized protein LOC108820059 [Raphanus sativus]KAJ4909123.1 hypothetical protein Rs2_03744 [Raphanus sativus]
MIKGRDGSRRSSTSSYPADLLVCFPSRAHLALTPKTICSPARPSFSTNHHPHHRRQLSRLSSGGGGRGYGSPALWAKQASGKRMSGEEITEPTSPKVTCAGQIKVRPRKRGGEGKNWQTVMEEIERIHNNKPKSKFLGFLTCLKNIKFNLTCFGDFGHADVIITSDDDEEDDEEEEENTNNVFSKWFMVLQEEESKSEDDKNIKKCVVVENADAEPAVPPSNALLLMRCRSAPAKSWLEERMQVKTEEEEMSVKKKKNKKDLRTLMEEDKMELVLMRYDTDYYRLSSDIAKETWVVEGVQDPLSRSRSWKS